MISRSLKSKSKNGRIGLCLEAARQASLLHWASRSFLPRLLFSLFAFHISLFARAGADWGFYYQAEIRDADGNVIVDSGGNIVHSHTVTIKLYPGASSSSEKMLWGRKYSVFCDNNGLFNVFLTDVDGVGIEGPTASLKSVIQSHASGDLYIALAIGDGPEIKPRQQVCAMPYANVCGSLAADATALGNLTVDGNCTVKGSLKAGSFVIDGVSPISVPVGGIILWAKDDVAPDGQSWVNGVSQDGTWAICDGEGGTPNLKKRFPVGASADYGVGGVGGAETVSLTLSQIPLHRHSVGETLKWTEICLDIHDDVWAGSTYYSMNNEDWEDDYPPRVKYSIIEFVQPTSETGSGEAHENRPPYRALYYVMRIN